MNLFRCERTDYSRRLVSTKLVWNLYQKCAWISADAFENIVVVQVLCDIYASDDIDIVDGAYLAQ